MKDETIKLIKETVKKYGFAPIVLNEKSEVTPIFDSIVNRGDDYIIITRDRFNEFLGSIDKT